MKRLGWTEILILPAALAALTTCWLTLWARWAVLVADVGYDAPTVSPPLMMITILAGAYVTRLAAASARDNLDLQRAQTIIAGSGLAAVAAVLWITFGSRFPFGYFGNFTEWGRLVSPEAAALAAAVVLWWRGIRIGRSDDLHDTARREFHTGVAALAVLFAAGKLYPVLTPAETFWPLILFFAIGLGSLALAGFEEDRRIQKDAAGSGLGVNRHWLAAVGSIIGAVLLGGVAVAAAVNPDTMAVLTHLLDTLALWVITIVGLFAYVLVWLLLPTITIIVNFLWALLRPLLGNLPTIEFDNPPPDPEDFVENMRLLVGAPAVRFAMFVILAIIVVLIFWIAVRRFRLLAAQGEADETRESVFSRELLMSQLKALFSRRGPPPPASPPYLALGAGEDPRIVVRRAYQTMLDWALSRSLRRAPAQTPALYAETIGAAAPQVAETITILTAVYVRARYDARPVSPDDARRAQAAAEQLLALRTADEKSPQRR